MTFSTHLSRLAGVATAALVLAASTGQASAVAVRHITARESAAAITAIATRPSVAPGVQLFGGATLYDQESDPTTCAGILVYPPSSTGRAIGMLESVIGTRQAGVAFLDVVTYKTPAQARAVSGRLVAADKKCPRRQKALYDYNGGTAMFTRVSQGAYRLGSWHGWVQVSTTKVAGHVWRAYQGTVVEGNAVVSVRWSVPASLETAATQKTVFNDLVRLLTHGLATVKA